MTSKIVQRKKGFTLVEVMVSGALLALLSISMTGPFIGAVRFQRDIRSVDEMVDNIQMILNVLDKELRTSSNPEIVTINGTQRLQFMNQEDILVQYYQDGSDLYKNIGNDDPIIYQGTQVFQFDQVNFDVSPETPDPDTPSRVTVSIRGVTNLSSTDNSMIFQTTIIPRNR